MDNQGALQFIMKSVHETLHLSSLGVDIIRSIPRQVSELIEVSDHILTSLPQPAEFILLPLNESAGNVLLAELLLEIIPADSITSLLESLGSFPPRPCWSCKIVGRIQHLLRFSHGCNFQVIVNGAKPVIGLKWVKSLGIGGWVGLLEVAQSGPLLSFTIPIAIAIAIAIVVVVVVVVVSGSYLLQGSNMSLTLSPGSLTFLHDERQKLGGGWVRWGWWCSSIHVGATSFHHPEVHRE